MHIVTTHEPKQTAPAERRRPLLLEKEMERLGIERLLNRLEEK